MTSRPAAATKDDTSEITNISPTPLRGTFFRVSGGSSIRSSSPRKKVAKQPVHIRMNLTEGQMDRLTDAFSYKMSDTPIKSQNIHRSPTSSPRRGKSNVGLRPNHRPSYSLDSNKFWEKEDKELSSATFSELMPRVVPSDPFFSLSSLAHRRQHSPPSPLKMKTKTEPTPSTQRSRSIPRRPHFETVSAMVSPLSPHRRMQSEPVVNKVSPTSEGSVYSQNSPMKLGSPLMVEQSPVLSNGLSSLQVQGGNNEASLLPHRALAGDPGYTTPLVVTPLVDATPTMPPSVPKRVERPRRSRGFTTDSINPYLLPTMYGQGNQGHGPQGPPGLRSPIRFNQDADMPPSTPFSPFPFYFRGEGQVVKKGEKKMIGENGWLERTDEGVSGVGGGGGPREKKKTPGKKAGFLDSLRKMAKDMTTELSNRPHQSMSSKDAPRAPMIQISLSAREQSLLYCEIEYHLTTILNDYITKQLALGLLSPTHLARVAAQWSSLGRPRVVAFRYDLETQLDLVLLHVREFQFHGRRQGNVVEVGGVLESMKRNARQMRVRTFCAPDSVVAKQLVDAQALCEVVGAEGHEGRMVEEVVQFFKACMEREALKRQGQAGGEVGEERLAVEGLGLAM